MAKETVNILKDKIDIVELLAQLNAALSEEWLAFYQYWVGSFVVEGAMRGDVQREFQEHAAEEYNHAKAISRPHYRAGRCARARPETVVRPCTLQVRRSRRFRFGSLIETECRIRALRYLPLSANCRIHQRN